MHSTIKGTLRQWWWCPTEGDASPSYIQIFGRCIASKGCQMLSLLCLPRRGKQRDITRCWRVGAIHGGKRSAAGTSEEAKAKVLPLLAAISESSGAAAPCLARACVQLKAKSRLAANKIAAGLQDVIAAHGGRSHCLFR